MGQVQRFRLICHCLSVMLAVTGLWQLMGPVVIATDPLLVGGAFQCRPECTFKPDPVRLMTDDLWKEAWRIEDIEQRIEDRVAIPNVRAMLFATALLRGLPLFMLFMCLTVAVRGFAVRGVTRKSVRWLRWATLASVAWTLAHPISDAVQRRAMNAVVRGREEYSFLVDPERLAIGLLIAGVAWICVRIIEESLVMKTNLDDYV